MPAPEKVYEEIVFENPSIYTVTAAAARIFAAWPRKFVFGFIIRVRSMGTATYIRLGTEAAQTYSLVGVSQTLEWWGFPGQVFDLAKLYAISDTADAVIEIFPIYAPVQTKLEVNEVEGRGK